MKDVFVGAFQQQLLERDPILAAAAAEARRAEQRRSKCAFAALLSTAALGALEAAASHVPEKSPRDAWVRLSARRKILNEARRERRLSYRTAAQVADGGTISNRDPATTDDDDARVNPISLRAGDRGALGAGTIDASRGGDAAARRRDAVRGGELLRDALGALSEEERALLLERFVDERSARQIGAATGVCEKTVTRKVRAVLDRLREFFTREGVTESPPVVHGVSAEVVDTRVSVAAIVTASEPCRCRALAARGADKRKRAGK